MRDGGYLNSIDVCEKAVSAENVVYGVTMLIVVDLIRVKHAVVIYDLLGQMHLIDSSGYSNYLRERSARMFTVALRVTVSDSN